MTSSRLLLAALLAAPLLTTLAVLTDPDVDAAAATVFVAAWTAFVAFWIAIAWLDLRAPDSRGRAAFATGIAAIVLAVLPTILGGLIVLPALCLIPLAASRGYRGRKAVSIVLLVVASLLYLAALFA